jgi:hypothetical protein
MASTFGDLLVRGPWIIKTSTSKLKAASPLVDGWFPTGDVATIDADGFMQITDRSKDVIKSGGEWISSIDVENVAMAHPAVAMAACIGMPHPKWDERPIVVVALKPGAELSREDLLAFYEGKTAKWQIPDDVVFVPAIPLGATGKMMKVSCASSSRTTRCRACDFGSSAWPRSREGDSSYGHSLTGRRRKACTLNLLSKTKEILDEICDEGCGRWRHAGRRVCGVRPEGRGRQDGSH